MTNRPLRAVLLLLFLAAMGATAYLFWVAEREARATQTAARTFDDRARTAEAQVAELRSAQQAYVAAGQGQDFWFTRAAKAFDDLRASITDLRTTGSTSQSVSAFDGALTTLQDFEQMDMRARAYARGHQPSLASDLIFSSGFDLAQKIGAAIEEARLAERGASDARIAAMNRREVFSLGAAAAASLLIVLLLMPAETVRESGMTAPVERPAGTFARPVAGLSPLDTEGWSPATRGGEKSGTRPEPAPAVPEAGPASTAAARPAAATPAPAPAAVEPLPPPKPRIDLQQVSSLCGDLARVVDTKTLPSLLERAADTLNAAGIVLWVADPDGRELAAIMAHGYAPNLVVRLGTIGRDAENATAAAFRTSLVQTVKADSVSNGAVAAPLVGAAGCVGVMAAEVRNRGEQDDTVLAAAGIIAAQLATLVAPPSNRAKTEAAG